MGEIPFGRETSRSGDPERSRMGVEFKVGCHVQM